MDQQAGKPFKGKVCKGSVHVPHAVLESHIILLSSSEVVLKESR